MLEVLLELVIGPLLVGAATLAARRWGARIGGVVSALPAIVGPVLLIAATERGAAFAGHAADGTLLGLVALSGFVVVYARVAVHVRWTFSLLAGWACAACVATIIGWVANGAGLAAGLGAAVASLLVAYAAMPKAGPRHVELHTGGVGARMAVTALLVACLASAALLVGPLVGGMLAALPILASVLAVFTHRQAGADAVVSLLRGMLLGMTGFVGFCAAVAWLIVPLGIAGAFVLAAAIAVGLQLLVLAPRARPAPVHT